MMEAQKITFSEKMLVYERKGNPGLKFNHRLALIGLRTTGSRNHFILSRWSMIIHMSVLLNRPVVDIH